MKIKSLSNHSFENLLLGKYKLSLNGKVEFGEVVEFREYKDTLFSRSYTGRKLQARVVEVYEEQLNVYLFGLEKVL